MIPENNRKEFIELIERYESITLEEIIDKKMELQYTDRHYEFGHLIARELFRFGTIHCILCKSAIYIQRNKPGRENDFRCKYCFYGGAFDCQREGKLEKTYNEILNATTPKKLLKAFRARAKVMRTLL